LYFFSKLPYTNTVTSWHFLRFRPQTQNINFWRSREKISEKKLASIFSKVGSKESHGNTDQKVGLQWYLEVLVVKLKKTLFLKFILKKILRKKPKKRENFEKINLVSSKLCYHPRSIWSIFKALIKPATSTSLREWVLQIWAFYKAISRQISKGDIPKTYATHRTNLHDHFPTYRNLIQSHLRTHTNI
jgi:hypothetical protein